VLLCQAARSHIPADSTDHIRSLLTTDRSIATYFFETVPFSFCALFTLKMATVLYVESLLTAQLNSESGRYAFGTVYVNSRRRAHAVTLSN